MKKVRWPLAHIKCHKMQKSDVTKMQIIFLTLFAFVATPIHICNVACKRQQITPDRHESSVISPLLHDLNRTLAHLQPTRSDQPSTMKPQLHDIQAAQLSLTSIRVTTQSEPQNISIQANTRGISPTASNQKALPAGPVANSLASVRSKWRQMEQTIGRSMLASSLELKQTLDDIYLTMEQQERQISQSCKQSLSDLVEGLRDQELWAGQMMDSSATTRGLPSGLLEGTMTDLGHFDECLAIGQRSADLTSGQYCSVLIKPALIGRPRLHTVCRRMPSLSPMLISNAASSGTGNSTLKLLAQQSHQFYYAGLRLGVCVPISCSQLDVERILQAYLIRFELIGQVKHCQRAAVSEDQNFKQNITARTIGGTGAKSSPLGQSISPNFDLLQQCILHNRPPVIKNTSDACARYVTHGLAGPAEATAQNGWQRLYQDQNQYRVDPKRTMANGWQPVELEQEESQLGLQRNPLVSFTSAVSPSSSSPISSDSGGKRFASDNLIPMLATNGSKVHFKEQAAQIGELKCKNSVKTDNNIAELVPIYDEIHLRGANSANNEPSLVREFFVCFSLKSNLRSIGKLSSQSGDKKAPGSNGNDRLSSAAQTQSMSDIKVIHGLRTMSMIWIIFGHTIGLVSPEMMNNLFALANLSCSSRLLQAVLNTTLAVDTFFMISGLVTVVSFVRKCKSAISVMVKPTSELSQIGRLERTLSNSKQARRNRGNDYHMEHDGEEHEEVPRANGSYSVNQSETPKAADLEFDQAVLDGMEIEVTSVDSSSSVVTSLSSSVSSNKFIGLSSKSSSQRNFIMNKTLHPVGGSCVQPDGLVVSGWPADFRPFTWLVMRYLRLTPAYAATIGFSVLMPALGSGPFWPETVGQLGPACRANWWTNLLYVNNFIETDNLCLIHSWYLSNDWQFFFVALVLFGLAYKSRKLALLVLVGLFVGSSATTFIVTVENDYPPTIVTTSPAVAERWEFIYSLYYKPWPHLPSYLIGLIVGCMILRLQLIGAIGGEQRMSSSSSWLHLSSGARIVCWLLSTLIALAVLNSIYPWNMGIQVDPILTGLHSATFRTLWAACCAWLVFALVSRPRNPLALLLSWHGFQITSRLTYCAYLVHPLVIYYHFGMLRERIDSSVYGQLHRFMGTLLISYFLAFVMSVCLESPSIRIQQFLARLLVKEVGVPNQSSEYKRTEPGSASRGRKPGTRKGGAARNIELTKKVSKGLDQIWTSTAEENANISSSSSLLKSAGGSSESENSNLPLKLARNQVTGQFFVRPMDFASDDSQLIEGYSFASHPLNPRTEQPARQQPACGLHESSATSGPHHQRVSANHSGVDEEFQQKLAQAIGRGFKIRTKIVNGKQFVDGIQTRRNGQAKRVPGLAAAGIGMAPIFAFDGSNQERIRSTRQAYKPMMARRNDAFSTFVYYPQGQGTNLSHDGNGQH